MTWNDGVNYFDSESHQNLINIDRYIILAYVNDKHRQTLGNMDTWLCLIKGRMKEGICAIRSSSRVSYENLQRTYQRLVSVNGSPLALAITEVRILSFQREGRQIIFQNNGFPVLIMTLSCDVGDRYLSQGDRSIHICKLFLVNVLRKGNGGPIVKCWLEQTGSPRNT